MMMIRKYGFKVVIMTLFAMAVGGLVLPSTGLSEQYHVDGPAEYLSIMPSLVAGDTVVWGSGVWHDVELEFSVSGTEENPIHIRAEEPGKAIFSGNSTWMISGSHLNISGFVFRDGYLDGSHQAIISLGSKKEDSVSHCRLSDIMIDGYNPPDSLTKYAWIRIYGKAHRVDHCVFQNQRHLGVTIKVMLQLAEAAHRIDHNYFLNRPAGPKPNGLECIQIAQSEDSMKNGHCVVEYNLFEACDGETEIVSSKSCENIYQYNTFRNCSGSLTLRHGDRNIVRHNIFLGEGKTGSGGVRVVGCDHRIENNYFSDLAGRTGGVIACYSGIPDSGLKGYFPATGCVIQENFFNCNGGAAINLNAGYARNNRILRPENIRLESNWIIGKDSSALAFVHSESKGLVHHDNLLHRRTEVGVDLPNDLTFATWLDWQERDGIRYPLAAKTIDGLHVEAPFDADEWHVLQSSDVGPSWDYLQRESSTSQELIFFNEKQLKLLKDTYHDSDSIFYLPWKALEARVQSILSERTLYSVTANERIPPSGDSQDYYSTGPYWWPDPDKPDGLPYIRKDGQFNPERDRVSDREPLHQMIADVRDLVLYNYVVGNMDAANFAAELLAHWFLDETTGMNPNLNHAQAIPGKTDGRGTGIVDTLKFTELMDSLRLLEMTTAWETYGLSGLNAWFDNYLNWLLLHPHGLHEYCAKNNHGTAFDLQVMSIASYVGKTSLVKSMLQISVKHRLLSQIESDGSQPLELKRTRAWSYTTENLHHFYRICLLSHTLDPSVFSIESASGASLKKAFEFTLPYVHDRDNWPYPQETVWQTEYIAAILHWASVMYRNEKYEDLFRTQPDAQTDIFIYLMQPVLDLTAD